MKQRLPRRDFLKTAAGVTVGISLLPLACRSGGEEEASEMLFKVSLAQWSLHKAYFGGSPGDTIGWGAFGQMLYTDYRSLLAGDIDPLDFPVLSRRDFDIDGIELVNTFYFDRAQDSEYLGELKNRADGEGVTILLIMCDALGNLGDPNDAARTQAVENHYPWVEAAAFLRCHSIRVNAASDASLSDDEQQRLAADGLSRLGEFGDQHGINVIVENHGGLSSNGQWLAGLMDLVDHPRVGTLPDFGNFYLTQPAMDIDEHPEAWYDRYQGVTELMPYAKAVSAKAQNFDEAGNCLDTDYLRMMKIVLDAGYRGYVGIEYEGDDLSEPDGIRATKALLERVRNELAPEYA
ncbi:MAG: TIM barrel protein [Gemmatimonadota bacterium]|nr:MAG: TIM barrel protein [Gemmatimonadota bacterium]